MVACIQVYSGVTNMTSIQENKNVETISLVKPTETRGGEHILISFLFFTFWFSSRHLTFRLRFRFLFFIFPFSFLTFWFSLCHLAFHFLFFTFPFPLLTFWFSLLHFFFRLRFRFLFFFTLSSFFSVLFIFTGLFRFTFQFLINYIMKTKTKTWV